jgi:Domain of unknown function (DUF2017)
MRGLQALGDGGYRLRLERHERELVDALAAELEQLVRADDEAVARLFPSAYKDDAAAEEEYRRLTRGSLAEGRLGALGTVRDTVEAERLDDRQADAWCTALNDMRLVLGERLGVTEDLYERELDRRDPRAPELAIYAWLTWLQASVVDALASRL